MTDYTKLVAALRGMDTGDSCPCEYYMMCEDSDCVLVQAADAIEALQAEGTDKDYLIQQQTHEIQRLMDDVKRQQKKMIELAKKLPKRSQWTNLRISIDGTSSAKMEVQE